MSRLIILVIGGVACLLGNASELWRNADWSGDGPISCERNTEIGDSWTIDDIVMDRPFRIRGFEWSSLIHWKDVFIPPTVDFILLDGSFGLLREMRDLGYSRRYERDGFGSKVYRFMIPQLSIALPAGHYYVSGRAVGMGKGRAFMCTTRIVRGTTEGYFRCAECGYPEWTPLRLFYIEPNDTAMAVLGDWGRYGDLNCDGAIDFGDVNPFVLALSNPDDYDRQYPDCNLYNGDCNEDQKVDFGDINPFVELLAGK